MTDNVRDLKLELTLDSSSARTVIFISNTSDDIQHIGGGMLGTPYPVEVTYGQGNFVDAEQAGDYSCAGSRLIARGAINRSPV